MLRIEEMTSVVQSASSAQGVSKNLEYPQMFDFEAAGGFDGLQIERNKDDFKKVLVKYGLDFNELDYAGVTSANVKVDTKTGKEILVLKSTECHYILELPIDENYAPEKIAFAAGEGHVYFEGINGTLKLLDRDSYHEYSFVNSNLEVYCQDGQVDRIAGSDKNTKLKIHTNEYCDEYYDQAEIGPVIDKKAGKVSRLRPGVTTIDTTQP